MLLKKVSTKVTLLVEPILISFWETFASAKKIKIEIVKVSTNQVVSNIFQDLRFEHSKY